MPIDKQQWYYVNQATNVIHRQRMDARGYREARTVCGINNRHVSDTNDTLMLNAVTAIDVGSYHKQPRCGNCFR